MSRIGILGGSFNPPHLAHLSLARHARDELPLDRVLLMPAYIQPQKPHEPDPGPAHRLAMCRLLASSEPGVDVCAMEIERGGASYTVDTLRAIHADHPEVGLTFILGADAARTIPSWREPAALLELAELAVAARGEAGREAVLAAIAGDGKPAGEGAGRIRFLEMPAAAISSSEARERAGRGEPIEALVGAEVAAYIAEHRLYRGGGDA